jgi:UPF0271 protein
MAATDPALAELIAATIASVDKSLILFGLSGSEMKPAALRAGLTYASEVFADRGYSDDGKLLPRKEKGAVILDVQAVISRAIQMVIYKCIESVSGITIGLEADTICIHGDNPNAPDLVSNMVRAFRQTGIEMISFSGK